MIRGAVAQIDLNALEHNFRAIKKVTKNRPTIAVVKADAYGHGAVEVSRRLSMLGVEFLSVAFIDEAKKLRDSGINEKIIVLFDTELEDVFEYNLIPVIFDKKSAYYLSREAERRNSKIHVHVKVDTGMGRLGFPLNSAIPDILEIANLKGIHVDGIMSHFSEADKPDSPFSRYQIDAFNRIRDGLLEKNIGIRYFHLANSAAILSLPESHFDAVRPGLMLYGYSAVKGNTFKGLLKPVMKIKTELVAIRRFKENSPISYGRSFITKRDSIIGVIRLGYADGFSRLLSNSSYVLVKGKKVPVVGTICMDLTMVDLTDLDDISEGEDVVILGDQGDECIDAEEIASWAKTIPYEILVSLGGRALRNYED